MTKVEKATNALALVAQVGIAIDMLLLAALVAKQLGVGLL